MMEQFSKKAYYGATDLLNSKGKPEEKDQRDVLSRRPSLELYKLRKEKEKETGFNLILYVFGIFKKNNILKTVLFGLILIIATVMERFSFKILANRMNFYDDILIFEIYLIFVIFLGSIVLVKSVLFDEITTQMSSFDTTELWKIAGIESIIFCIQLISASHVNIIMTIILLQINIPIIFLLSKSFDTNVLINENKNEIKFSKLQLIGIFTMTMSLILSILFLFIDFTFGKSNNEIFIKNIIYFVASASQGLLILYKEKTLNQFSLHIDHHYLNCWLYYYQFLSSFIIFSLINCFYFYFSNQIFKNLTEHWQNGISCSFGINNFENDFDNKNNCHSILVTVIIFVLSNVAILLCIDKLTAMNGRILNTVHMLAIITAILLFLYNPFIYNMLNNDDFNKNDDFLKYIIIVSSLLIGMELYGNTEIDEYRDGLMLNNNDHNTTSMIMKVMHSSNQEQSEA